MHDRDAKAPSERAKLAGACAAGRVEEWKAFWLASLLYELQLLMRNSLTSPHLTASTIL